ncbi:hypothetical protein [Porphyrobacter sp. ULC335]|uniref:hypothetical protein n=1 Tax=Porphyrobacter sp. ULC335 TaxID=2854260 RepID=UPI00221FB105|nr:hypothetical protein [Porphyrobacter sp. ULC335]UYV15710.1 hypothetical protein KVF90_16845 [Porphyrobacter sp. ULC335]
MRRFCSAGLLGTALLAAGLGALAPLAAQDAPPEPVYRGRAIFEPVTPPIVPQTFLGRWVNETAECDKARPGDALLIASHSVTLSGKQRKIAGVLLRPDQEPPARDAILELGMGKGKPVVLILSQTDDGTLRLRIRGSETARIFRRCPVR